MFDLGDVTQPFRSDLDPGCSVAQTTYSQRGRPEQGDLGGPHPT